MSLRVLITREKAEPLLGMLAAGGATPVHVPLVALEPTGAHAPQTSPGVVVITSAAVVRLVPELADRLPAAPVAAVGQATAEALRQAGVVPVWVGDAGGQALLATLPDSSARLWYVGADSPSEGVTKGLDAHAGPVDNWPVYTNRLPPGAADALRRAGHVDIVALTSPSAAVRYAELAGSTAAQVAVIGSSTAAVAERAGLEVVAQPDTPSLEGLAAVILAG